MELLDKIHLALEELQADHFKIKLENGHLNILIVAPYFAQMSLLKRQQTVLGAVKSFVATGEVHAVNIKALTPEGYQQYLAEQQ